MRLRKEADCRVSRICVAYEAGRDDFWLARCLRGSGIEAHVMHSTSIPVKTGPSPGKD